MAIFVLLFNMCSKENVNDADKIPPSEVLGLKIIHGNSTIDLSWKDPDNFDFNKVEISYPSSSIEVEKGKESAEIFGLVNDSVYVFTIKTMDFSENKSPGVQIEGKPKAPPLLHWEDSVSTVLHYSNQGQPTGGFTTLREFTNLGSQGYIDMIIYIFELSTQDTISEFNRRFLVEANQEYIFTFIANGDISIFNCTTCDTANANYKIEFTSLSDSEIFYTIPTICEIIPVCANGNENKETRWNSISIKDLYLEVVEK